MTFEVFGCDCLSPQHVSWRSSTISAPQRQRPDKRRAAERCQWARSDYPLFLQNKPPIVALATLTGRPWGRPTIESSIGRPAPCARPPAPSRDESLFQSIPSRGAARILGRPRLRQRFSICCSSESGYPPVRSVLTLTMRILVGIVAPAAASVWTKPITRCRRFGLRRRRRATASYKDLRFFHRPRRSVLRYSHGRIVAVAFQLEGRSQWRWLFPFAHSLTPVTPAKLLFLPSFIAAKIGVCPPARRSPNHGHSSYFLVSP